LQTIFRGNIPRSENDRTEDGILPCQEQQLASGLLRFCRLGAEQALGQGNHLQQMVLTEFVKRRCQAKALLD
jgi:hypothetical protein